MKLILTLIAIPILPLLAQTSLDHDKIMKELQAEIREAQAVRDRFFADPFFEKDSFDFQDSVKISEQEKGKEIVVTITPTGEFLQGLNIAVKNHQITIKGELTTIAENEDANGNRTKSKSVRSIMKSVPVPGGADEASALIAKDGKSFSITFKKIKS